MSEEPVVIMGFQDSFRSGVRSTTERVLQRLGAEVRLNHVLLVATPREGDGPSYVVPQPMADAVDLGDLHAEVQDRIEDHPEAGVFDSHPYAAELRQGRIRREAVSEAIAGRVGASDALDGHPEAVTVDRQGYHFTVCLLLPQALDEVITPLPPFTWGTVPTTVSLLTAGLEEIKDRVAYDLQLPEPGPPDLSLSAEEIADRAASRFFRDALYRAGTFLELDFETVDQVAATTYEKGAAKGLMVVSPKGHEAVERVVAFSTRVNSRQVRQIRKLLETSSADHVLLVSDGSVIGMGSLDRSADISDVMEIHITGHDRWGLHHEGAPLMVVNRGVARVPQPTFDVARLRDHAPRVLGEDVNDRQLLELVSAAATLGHGSTIVVTRDAAQEADRLGGQAFSVDPDELTVERLEALSHVDGAFLLDAQCVMYAFGVILDGAAQADGGDPARGLGTTPLPATSTASGEAGLWRSSPLTTVASTCSRTCRSACPEPTSRTRSSSWNRAQATPIGSRRSWTPNGDFAPSAII